MRERYHSDARSVRVSRRLKLVSQDERMADAEIRAFAMGEPSAAFFPAQSSELDTFGHTVFEASKAPQLASASITTERVRQERRVDRAKRRAEVINTLLEHPQEFQEASRASLKVLFRRQFARILHFAQTLQNKGRLHPEMEEILNSARREAS